MEEGKMDKHEATHTTAPLDREMTSDGLTTGNASHTMETLSSPQTESRSKEQPLQNDPTNANNGAKDETAPTVEAAHVGEAPEAATTSNDIINGAASTRNGDVVVTDEAADAGAKAINNLSIEATSKPNNDEETKLNNASKVNSASFDPDKCVTCQEVPGKYKCPRCFLKYCSVACNKLHKPTHDNDPEPPKPAQQPVAHPADEVSEEKIGLHGRKLNHPYKTLQHSKELQWLFNKYPRLPDLLLEIYSATEAPPSARSRIPASLMMALPENQQHDKGWSQERRIHEGRTKLRAARGEAGEDGEAIREYCLLVSSLLDEAKDR